MLFLGREELRLGKGIKMFIEPFSVTFCCVSKTHKEAFEQVSNLRCLFKKRRKTLLLFVHK